MKILKYLTVYVFGGLAYGIVELCWRGETHISMFVVGGFCFFMIYLADEARIFGGNIFLQAPLNAAIITLSELTSGIIINQFMRLNVWDYADLPLNLWGQICLPFSGLWLLLSLPATLAARGIRRGVFREGAKRYAG